MAARKRILIIDDEADIRRTLQLWLTMNGFEVLLSQNGQDGLSRVKNEYPDLIVLDLKLPDMPGEEVCRQLKSNETYCNLPIIMLTAKNSDVDRVIGRVIGADSYVNKPFDPEELLKKISACLIENDLSHSA